MFVSSDVNVASFLIGCKPIDRPTGIGERGICFTRMVFPEHEVLVIWDAAATKEKEKEEEEEETKDR